MTQKIVFLLALSYSSLAQIHVLNEKNLQPIESVEVYSDQGILLGLSDSKGEIPLKSPATLLFSHFLYESKKCAASQDIYLKPRGIQLADVQVKSNKRKLGVLLKGYFRSFQFRNDSLEFFSDGEIEVLVPANPNKSVEYKHIQQRNFKGPLFKMAFQGKSTSYGITITLPPIIELIRTRDLQASVRASNTKQDSVALIQAETGIPWGQMNRINPRLHQVAIHQYPERKPIVLKSLGMESHILVNDEESIAQVENRENLDPIQLIYHKNVHKIDFKAKGKSTFDQYHSITEFFIHSAEIETGDEKGFSKRTSLGSKTRYTEPYWEKAYSHPNFKPLPLAIEEEIKRQTKETLLP
ncbi:MAG: hypothetical protein RL422_2042 [Bacteroidota bacterium]|jgi:hypothetical protein